MFNATHVTAIQTVSRPSLMAQTNASFPFVMALKQESGGREKLVSFTKAASEADFNAPVTVAAFRDFTRLFSPVVDEVDLQGGIKTRTGEVTKSGRELHYRYGIGSL
jgi:hypothetical protein